MSLADRMRAERRLTVKVGAATFTGDRATMEQALSYSAVRLSDAEVCRRHITGWEGVKESDVLSGGKNEEIPFDAEVFAMVISERRDWWGPIAAALLKDASDRVEERRENEKKLNSGSSISNSRKK